MNNVMNQAMTIDITPNEITAPKSRQRASDNPPNLQGQTRTQARDQMVKQFLNGEFSQGDLLKKLRLEVLGVKQDEFAKLVKVSRKTISDVENNHGNYSVKTINQIFRPFRLALKLSYMD